ncbi:MAG: glycosyltransferase family 25 protein, partial [Pacificimonas sp.]
MRIKVIVISLSEDVDRRARFAADAPEDGLDWQFFDAHRKPTGGLSYDPADALVAKGRHLTPGELGCYSSHYATWRQLLGDDVDGYVVLEDDVFVDWNFLDALAGQDLSAEGISFLRLYYKLPERALVRRKNFVRRSTSLVELLDLSFGIQGYFIGKPAAARFTRQFAKIVRPIDDQMDRH